MSFTPQSYDTNSRLNDKRLQQIINKQTLIFIVPSLYNIQCKCLHLKTSTHLEQANLNIQREAVECHGTDEGYSRGHSIHYLKVSVQPQSLQLG